LGHGVKTRLLLVFTVGCLFIAVFLWNNRDSVGHPHAPPNDSVASLPPGQGKPSDISRGEVTVDSEVDFSTPLQNLRQVPIDSKNTARTGILTEDLRATAGQTVAIAEAEDPYAIAIDYTRDPEDPPSARKVIHDWEIDALVDKGDISSTRRLLDTVTSDEFDLESRQNALWAVNSLLEDSSALVPFLHSVIDNPNQPEELRVEALLNLLDHDLPAFLSYANNPDDSISGEVDLYLRVQSYRAQLANAGIERDFDAPPRLPLRGPESAPITPSSQSPDNQ
jgi:hypothetical protein